ncbi:MAG: hypothetical protein WD689_02010 [Gaiellaceae bacterium]
MTTTAPDLEWARDQITTYRERYPDYELYASVLKDVLDQAVPKLAPLSIVTARPKSIASFGEKIWRKRDRYRQPVNRMTDLCGARVITHTAAQVRVVSEFIEQHFEIDWDNTVDVGQRLKPTEFGYRSVHYIVKFKRGVFPSAEVDVDVPSLLYRMPNRRAEVQVRTILEHAWADILHDLVYKSPFRVPEQWVREVAGLAALLEGADASVARIQEGLAAFRASYGDYLSREQMHEEIEKLAIVLEHDPGNADLANRIGKLAITLGEWSVAIRVLGAAARTRNPAVLRDLGIAVCKLHETRPEGRKFRQGQRLIERAVALDDRDWDALSSLAGTWRGIDDAQARRLYRRALEADPTNSYPLGNVLAYEIAEQKDLSVVALMGPTIEAAIARSREQAEVGINLPWAYYSVAKFHLLLGRPYDGLAAYAKAIDVTTADWVLDSSQQSLEGLAPAAESILGYEAARRLLLVARAAMFGSTGPEVAALASPGPAIAGPVVIVAGGCDPSVEEEMQGYRDLLLDAFSEFEGTILSGGTREGISGLVGDLCERYPAVIRAIGYLPASGLPADATVDDRYSELRRTDGTGFSALEPLQNWIDLITAGVAPGDVRLIGINGGMIAATEYRLALALGARVALLEESGREAARLLPDPAWSGSPLLSRLPRDPSALRAFLV